MARASCNPVVHLELHTRDSAHACELYRELCGWRPRRIEAAGRSYLALELGSEVGGGVVECDTGRPLWLPYVEVANVAVATDQASELGATVLLAPREGPAGWRSVIATSAGGEVAFWQAKHSR